MNVRVLPTKGQWKKWALPSKATFIGTVVGILMGAFTILTYLFESSPQIFKKGSSNIQISVGKMQGNLAAANDITATALERSTAVVNTGTGNVYISGISEERFQQIAEELGVTRSALNNFFRILEQKQVSPEELDTRLRDIAKNYKELQEKLKAFTAGDPVVVALKQEASQVLEAGDFLRVEQLLIQASERDLEAAKQLQEAATERLLSAAASKAEIGTLKMIELAYRDSTAYFRQAVDLVPRDAPLTRADYLNDLGAVLILVGDYTEARFPLASALQIRERVLGPEHPTVALSLLNLATLHVEQHHYDQAELLATRALHIDEKTLGPKHPKVAGDLNLLATIYQQRREYDQAEPLHERALKIDEEVLGAGHPHVAIDLNNLAVLYYRQHKYEDAVSTHQRALTINKKVLGPEHPNVANDLNNLAVAYAALGKAEQAEPRHQQAIALAETVLGPEHPSVVSYLKAYANTLRKFHRDAEAETLEARARAILNKRARTEGITGPVSWRVTALQVAKRTIDGMEMPGYSFELLLKELHGVGITFGSTDPWHLLPRGEQSLYFFFHRPCEDRKAETCDGRGLVAPSWNLMLGGINDRGQTFQLPIDIILPALPDGL